MTTLPDDAPVVTHETELWSQGFVMIPNLLVRRGDLSVFDKMLWGYLSHLALMQHTEAVEPLRASVAGDLGVTEKTVTVGMRALQNAPCAEGDDRAGAPKLLTAKRRGLGRTNVYVLAAPEGPESDPSRKVKITHPEGEKRPIPPSLLERGTKNKTPLKPPPPEGSISASSEDDADEPPVIGKVGGKNPALDTLLEVCGWDPANARRTAQATAALYGRRHKTTGRLLVQGVTHLYWLEVRRFVEGHPEHAGRLAEIRGDPAAYGTALANTIAKKAALYRETMPRGTLLTPTALASWWLDLERQANTNAGRGGADNPTADEIREALRDG